MLDHNRKYGIFTWFGYARPMEEKLDLIKAAGFHSVCSWWGDSFSGLDGPKEEIAVLAAARGLHLENAHMPYEEQDLLWQDTEAGEDLHKKLEADILKAAEVGIPVLVIHPYRSRRVLLEGQEALFFRRARQLGEAAGRRGVLLAWENLKESRLLRTLMEELADQENSGFCLDTGHANISRDGALSLLTDFPDKLFALHLHDNDGKEDQHLPPGQGTFPWQDFMDKLKKTEYQGSLMLESSYPYDEKRAEELGNPPYLEPGLPPEEYLQEAFESVCRLDADWNFSGSLG